VSGSGISWACASLQTDNHASTSPLSFYRPDTLPAAQPTSTEEDVLTVTVKYWLLKVLQLQQQKH